MKKFKMTLFTRDNKAVYSEDIEADTVKEAKEKLRWMVRLFSPVLYQLGWVGAKRIR